jgi:lipoprotein-anchoring transpeptidase ErfK/SrfK
MSDDSILLNRRAFLGVSAFGAASMALSACTSIDSDLAPGVPSPAPATDFATIYGPITDEGYQLPAIPLTKLDQRFLRQVVDDPTGERPGTIVVDTTTHFLYAVQPGGKAVRYGVSLGKAGFGWAGTALIQWKKKWPTWTPPPEMIKRRPELAKYSAENGGMPPGPQNPLGARALYIFRDGKDTMYRLHGTLEWDSIGKNASSGCVRLMNQDVVDLYSRIPGKTPIIVRAAVGSQMSATSTDRSSIAIDDGVPKDAELLN